MSTLRYIFLLMMGLYLGISQPVKAQSDTLFQPSIIVGMDVSGLVRELFEPGTRQWEWSVSTEWRKNWYATMEAGMLNIGIEKETHNYFADGWFLRAGIDYNMLERNEKNQSDLLLLMFRYGIGNLSHESTSLIISNPYWGDYNTSLSPESYTAHWLEIGAGIKARVAANFFLGWSIRTRLVFARSQDFEMDPYIISGFGKTINNPNVMIQYSLFYLFPF